MSRILVTPALPYANGNIHLGHLVEHIQVNTYVRALRMAGDDVLYVCGADSHGAPIEIAALKAGRDPAEYVEGVRAAQEASFQRFHVEFDGGYGSTHTPENAAHAARIFEALRAKGHIATREVEQLQDPTDGRFLADRFVKGTCPRCNAVDQYGDSCEVCGSTYRATELKDPRSVITGATPRLAKSAHYFVKLGAYADALKDYLGTAGVLHPSLQNFLETWFKDGLKDWDISRDGPYFGFKIPGEDNKYFYVWLDAPIGYISLTERALRSRGGSWQTWWQDSSTRVEHFIGKDILYFHTLFWPAMLMASGSNLPHAVRVHGMLTVDGVKMSKSRGTFLNADDFAAVVETQALRYYFAAKMTAEPQDIDLSLEDFVHRTNADLVNNIVNLVSRTVPQLHRNFGGVPGALAPELGDLVDEVRLTAKKVEAMYRGIDFAGVVRAVVELGSKANKVLQDTAPWELVKSDAERARGILTTTLWVGKTCLALLKPVLPEVARKVEKLLDVEPFTFATADAALDTTRAIAPYERLFERLDMKAVLALVKPTEPTPSTTEAAQKDASKAAAKEPAKKEAGKKASKEPEPPPAEIAFDDFAKVDLRAAKVLEAKAVDGSDKLILVRADVGALGIREIFTGLRPHVQPEQLVGRTVVVVANLAPRKMAKFGTSHGMILAAGDIPQPLFVDGAPAGERVR